MRRWPNSPRDNAQGEYYLTDVVAWMTVRGHGVEAVILDDAAEMHGVNSRSDLAEVGRLVVDRHLDALMASGVTMIDPAATWIDDSCRLEADVVIEPGRGPHRRMHHRWWGHHRREQRAQGSDRGRGRSRTATDSARRVHRRVLG
jgi:hypothetical protein